MKKILILLFYTYFCTAYAQNIGDYQSKGTGNWNDYNTWEVYNGTTWVAVTSGYPGKSTAPIGTIPAGNATAAVTIQPCHEVTMNTGAKRNKVNSYVNIQKLTVKGRMKLIENNDVVFGDDLQEVIIDGGSIFWSSNPTNLYLPQNCLITLLNLNSTACSFPKGLQPIANCTGSQNLYIGGTKPYSSCNGEGNNTGGTFEDVNEAGGTNFAALPLTNPSAVCLSDNKPIQFSGSIIKYIPGAVGTLTYKWELIRAPSGYFFPPKFSQSVNIGTLTAPGDYEFKLTVTSTSLNVSNEKKFVISVDGTTSYNGVLWDNGIPSEGNHRHAVINSPYVTADQGAFSACSCTVNAGQKLTVSADTTVNLVGKLTNNGTAENVVIESDGNLIQKLNVSNTDAVTVQRYVTDMDNVLATQMDYIYWSAPVSGQKLRGTAAEGGFSPGTPTNRFFEYNESNDYFVSTSDVTFKAGKGYAIRAEDGFDNGYNKTYEFKGVPNNGDVPILIKRSVNTGVGGTVIHGYNLVGNPYPSNIDFDVLYANNSGLIYNTAWFWNNTYYTPNQQGSSYSGNNYAVYNGTGGNNAPSTGGTAAASSIIKAGQGFLVQVRTAPGTSGNLNFKNSYNGQNLRVSTGGAFYQKGGGEKNRFWLNLVSPNGIANSQLIGYVEGATYGYEQDYDAEILELSSDIFYSQSGDRKLLIQGKGAFTDSDKVLLGANFFSEGSYMITLQQAEGIFAGDQEIWLKDHETGSTVNLSKEKNYRFKAKKGESSGRFEILYQNLGSVVAPQESPRESLTVYKDGDHFVVKATEQISSVEIYDAAGKLLSRTESSMSQARVNAAQLNPGVYILRITHNGKVSTRKILK